MAFDMSDPRSPSAAPASGRASRWALVVAALLVGVAGCRACGGRAASTATSGSGSSVAPAGAPAAEEQAKRAPACAGGDKWSEACIKCLEAHCKAEDVRCFGATAPQAEAPGSPCNGLAKCLCTCPALGSENCPMKCATEKGAACAECFGPLGQCIGKFCEETCG